MCIGSSPKPPDTRPAAEAQRYAADLQYKASQESLQLFRDQYKQARSDLTPWRDAGLEALETVKKMNADGEFYREFKQPTEGDMMVDPGYQFRVSQGERALTRNYGGSGQKGAFGKALLTYGQNMASQEYGNVYNRSLTTHQQNYGQQVDKYNRFAGLAGTGQQTSLNLASLGQQSVQNQSGALQYGASALGAGEVGAQNTLLSGEMAAYNAEQSQSNSMLSLGLTVVGGVLGGVAGASLGASIGGGLSGGGGSGSGVRAYDSPYGRGYGSYGSPYSPYWS